MNNVNKYRLFEEMTPKRGFVPDGSWHHSIQAERLDRVGHWLTSPASWWLNGFSRVVLLEFKPGWWGQRESAVGEGLQRVAWVVSLVVTSPFALLGLLLGAPMRALATCWKNDFVYQRPNCAAQLYPRREIKVLSFNTLLMPEFLVMRNKQRPAKERVHEVADGLIEQNLDLICLQEVFHTEAAAILAERLKKEGYHVVFNMGHQRMGLNSGLMVASKHELQDIQFFEHPSLKVGADAHAKKELFLATCNIDGKTYIVGNTHLNGGGSKGDLRGYGVRALQLLAIQAHIARYANELNRRVDGIILSGDTNIAPTDHDNPRLIENGNRQTAKSEPEWFLAHRLHKMDRLPIPEPEALSDPQAWDKYIALVKREFEDIDQAHQMDDCIDIKTGFMKTKRLEGEPLRQSINTEPGSFFGPSFKHDLQGEYGEIYPRALKGSTIDTDASKDVGFGTDLIEQPERVDAVAIHEGYQTEKGHIVGEPKLFSVEILPMVNKKGMFISDHLGVLATIQAT